MKKTTMSLGLSALGLGLALLPQLGMAAGTVQVDGSSTVYPITEAVAEEFQTQQRGATKVTVGISGTGGGFKKFCRGETDVQDASRPILQKEIDACKEGGVTYIELPIAFDALTVVISPSNSWATNLTTAELKTIWSAESQGKITKWNQVRASFPDAPIKLYGPGADSGTFDYFTEAINGKAKSSRGDYTASEDDNVLVQGVSSDKNALGYFGMAYYQENTKKLKAVGIDTGKGGVLPSEKTILDGSYQPLARPLFIYVNAKSLAKPEVKAFVDFYLKNAAALAKEVKFVQLPAAAYQVGQDRVKKMTIGTAFGGKDSIGGTINDILKKQPQP